MPLSIVESLKKKALWQQLDITTLSLAFFTSLAKPRSVTDREKKLQQYKFEQSVEGGDAAYTMVFKASTIAKSAFAFMFEDDEHRQYVLVFNTPVPTANYATSKLVQLYQSRYLRKHVRYDAHESSIFIDNVAVLAAEIDPEILKTRLDIIFQSNQRSLEKSIGQVQIATYKKDDEPLLQVVKAKNRAIFVEDTTDLEAYSRESYYNIGGQKIGFASYLSLYDEYAPYDLVKHYRDRRITSEIIIPILYKVSDEKKYNLGYVRLNKGKDDRLSWENVIFGIQSTIEAILATIRTNNYTIITGAERVIDISAGGMRLLFTKPDIIRSLPNSDIIRARLNFSNGERIGCKLKIIYSTMVDGHVESGVKFLDMKTEAEGDEARLQAAEILRREIKTLDPLL